MSIVKVRNLYVGSKQLDPISLGGGIKAAYMGNVMVYGEYEKEDEVKYYFYDFSDKLGPYLFQLTRTNAAPLMMCTPRNEEYNIQAIQDVNTTYRNSGVLPDGDLTFVGFHYIVYMHNAAKNTTMEYLYYKYGGDPPTPSSTPTGKFAFPMNYSNGEIKTSTEYVGGNNQYSIYEFSIQIKLELARDKGDIYFWIGKQSSTPTNPPQYIVTNTVLYIRFHNREKISSNEFVGVDSVDLNIGNKYTLSRTQSQAADYYPASTEVMGLCNTLYNLGDSYNQIDVSITGTIQLHTNIQTSKFYEIILHGDANEVLWITQPHYSSSFSNTHKLTISNTNHIYRKIVSQLYLDIYF